MSGPGDIYDSSFCISSRFLKFEVQDYTSSSISQLPKRNAAWAILKDINQKKVEEKLEDSRVCYVC